VHAPEVKSPQKLSAARYVQGSVSRDCGLLAAQTLTRSEALHDTNCGLAYDIPEDDGEEEMKDEEDEDMEEDEDKEEEEEEENDDAVDDLDVADDGDVEVEVEVAEDDDDLGIAAEGEGHHSRSGLDLGQTSAKP
jgi:hypothetical protein